MSGVSDGRVRVREGKGREGRKGRYEEGCDHCSLALVVVVVVVDCGEVERVDVESSVT